MKRPIDLQGHRGARGLYPENTMAGFAAAVALGVDTLELDVVMTADGVMVVTHDPRLNPNITRTTDGAWLTEPGPAIRSMRWAELANYDVGQIRPGSAYASEFPDQSPRDGSRIPALADVLRIDPAIKYNVELKSLPDSDEGVRFANAVAVAADAAGATARITVQSFDWRGPRWLRRARPDVRLAWLTRSGILDDARTWWDGAHPSDYGNSVPRAVAAEGGPIWAPHHADLSEASLIEAHALRLSVVPWTVNQPADMTRLLRWGVDGLITDRPDLARVVLTKQGLPLPTPRPMLATD